MELLYKLMKKKNTYKPTSSFNKQVEQQTQSTIGLEGLYRSLFELEEWIFLSNQWDDVDTANPLIATLENKKWVYVFTDATMVMNYVKANPEFMTENGSVLVIKIAVDRALKLMKKLAFRDVYGIRVNEVSTGSTSTELVETELVEVGWNFPISELDALLFHLEKTNTL